ncbi:MAG: hypothetical protein ACI8YQ_002941 [Polaribacter sp.]|jgi:uncharacterized protein (DUF2237 family)
MKKVIVIILSITILLFFYSFFPYNQKNNDTMKIVTKESRNILGEALQACCFEPATGWFRDGYCNTDMNDRGVHVVCAIMTDEFLNYSASCGNNLKTPAPNYGFPGLKAGDKWCLCLSRWKEAMEAGLAPPIVSAGTHEKALEVVSLEDLKRHEYVEQE